MAAMAETIHPGVTSIRLSRAARGNDSRTGSRARKTIARMADSSHSKPFISDSVAPTGSSSTEAIQAASSRRLRPNATMINARPTMLERK